MRKIFFGAMIMVLTAFSWVKAQDTTWVQTLTFEDITKRRGQYLFPKKDEYRKILMYYTLKCDKATTQDRFNCGEWDYLTYNYVYDHDATYDSTYQSGANFRYNGSERDELKYVTSPVYDYHRRSFDQIVYKDTLSYNDVEMSFGNLSSSEFLPTEGKTTVSQFMWKQTELSAAGIAPGEITGLKFNVLQSGGGMDVLKISMAETMDDTLSWDNKDATFEVCYEQPTELAVGWASVPFVRPFQWNGTGNVMVRIEVENRSGKAKPYLLEGHNTIFKSGFTKTSNQTVLELNKGGDFANLGREVQVDGNDKRTIELWAYTKEFNGAGLFQGGNTGSNLKDWSLRTMGSDEDWRIQLWGADGDATLDGSKEAWHHYALVHTGAATILYYDGKFVRQKLTEVETPDRDLWLGRWSGSYFNGYIDNVRVWEGAVSASDLGAWKDKEIDETHPLYGKLRAHYSFDNDTSLWVTDSYGNKKYTGTLMGNAWWKELSVYEGYHGAEQMTDRPNIIFEQGEFISEYKEITVDEKVLRRPGTLQLYDNPSNGKIIRDESKKHPSLVTDTVIVWEADNYSYVYDYNTGDKLDSTFVAATSTLKKETKEWYSPTVRYEIGRYITPYGINLSLGPKGFTWVYDITEYAGLLHDSVDLSAGNQQELIDLRFAFIKGTPIHEVKQINQVWRHGSYSYGALDDDDQLSATEVDLVDDAETFVMRTRLTGHGHNSDNGEAPHCCEWKDNTHYLFVDGKQVADWHIWREDCDLNPVYPQGGNWVGAREGWCPGDVVGNFDFNITPHISSNRVELDYDLTDVPANNQGMRGGNYRMAMQLFQFGEASFTTDAEIVMVKRPTDWGYYQRMNPACASPVISVKNTGSGDITSMTIEYGVSGGTKKTFEWTGDLPFLEVIDIELPIEASQFWVGDDDHIFTATVAEVNGSADQYDANNSYTTHFELPEILPRERFYVQLRTNNVPEANAFEIRDASGKLVDRKEGFAANTLYREPFDLANGCYTFTFFDEGYGLDYWAWPAQGSGTLNITDEDGKILKSFDPDFGEQVYWPFAVGTVSTVQEIVRAEGLQVYPNPSEGSFTIELSNVHADYHVEVYSSTGQLVYTQRQKGTGINLHTLNLDASNGVYVVKVQTEKQLLTERVLIK